CAECGSHLLRDELGWRCGECAFRRPSTRWVLDGDRVIDSAGRISDLSLSLPGRAHRSNAVVALAVSAVSGVETAQALPRPRDVAVRLEADLVAFDLVDGVDEAVDQVEGTSLDVIANYTAFQQIRVALGRAD